MCVYVYIQQNEFGLTDPDPDPLVNSSPILWIRIALANQKRLAIAIVDSKWEIPTDPIIQIQNVWRSLYGRFGFWTRIRIGQSRLVLLYMCKRVCVLGGRAA